MSSFFLQLFFMKCMIKGSCTALHYSNTDFHLLSDPLCRGYAVIYNQGGEGVILPATSLSGWKTQRMDVDCLANKFIEQHRFLVNRQDQDICETDGFFFLLQPFHIFSSFLELYDTVFHKPAVAMPLMLCVILEDFTIDEIPCCTTAPQSGSWATCSRISSTSRFFPGGSTSFVILCWRVRGNAISWMNWPSGLLSTYTGT